MNLRLRTMAVCVLMGLSSTTGATENVSTAQIQETRVQVNVVAKVEEFTITQKIDESWYYPNIPIDREVQKFVHSYSERTKIPELLVYAQIKCESNFDPNLIGEDGDTGYLQILKSNQKFLEREMKREVNLLDEYDNIESGMLLLYYNLSNLEDFNGKEKYIRGLNVYNMGSSNYNRVARSKGWNSWHYGKRVYACYEQYLEGNFSYDPYK